MNVNVTSLKHDLRAYARVHDLTLPDPPVVWTSDVWGAAAQQLAYRVSKHRTGKGTSDKAKLWAMFHPAPPRLHIIQPDYRWNGYPVERIGKPGGVVWHHTDANDGVAGDGAADVQGIHAYHRDTLHWRGIGYHLFAAFNGDVFQGRPLGTIGGHALNAGDWIGVAAEGDYEQKGAKMPPKQLAALQAVHRMLRAKYGPLKDMRHRDVPGNSTACPGQAFPFAQIVSAS